MVRALSERTDPSDTDLDPDDVEDQCVTVKQAIAMPCAAKVDLDKVTS
jgi:hypothetical protein